MAGDLNVNGISSEKDDVISRVVNNFDRISSQSDFEIKLKIPGKVKNRLPENFNINDIGNIDLREAEAIANENILFLNESDLIEELEDFDLIPLNEALQPDIAQKADIKGPRKHSYAESSRIEEAHNVAPIHIPQTEPALREESAPPADISPYSAVKTEPPVEEIVPLPYIPDQESAEKNLKADKEPYAGEAIAQPDVAHTEEGAENFSERPETDIGDVKSDQKDSFGSLTLEEEGCEDTSSDMEPFLVKPEEKVGILSRMDEVELIDDLGASEILIPGAAEKETVDKARLSVQQQAALITESLPEWASALGSSSDNIMIIDDSLVEKEFEPFERSDEEKELEKITLKILETSEGKPKVLLEADIEDDKENIAYSTMSGIAPDFDDLLVDFEDDEIKYKDDDLDFIHSAVIEEDYSKYLSQIDVYHGLSADRKVTTAVELLGLTHDEQDEINDLLFAENYKGVNFEEIFNFFKAQQGGFESSTIADLITTYMLPFKDSLLDSEKKSIEKDISSKFALIFEEDVDPARGHFKEVFVETKPEPASRVEEIRDITDRVVIIEDEADLQRFVHEMPEDKRADMVRLMKYLDGLFEKLPENTVKNFANSEYFDLYVKILNDLGV